ncbi:hypothetical protein [Exiguobacterium sp. s168]|uniref:hypothetical protein n=1 Tax=Exiguobacterium sp. s168 TaxID=2751194 RepID=UPI00068EAAE9|nr:hypothetical protein [Exiguobacterium sp. s168]
MNYISGGYYLVELKERPSYIEKKIMPDKVLSLSSCICNIHPSIDVFWGDSNVNKLQYMDDWNLSTLDYKELENWIEKNFKKNVFLYPQVFSSVKLAKEIKKKFFDFDNIYIIGIALPEQYVNDFVNFENSLNKIELDRYGVESLLLKKDRINLENTEFLGYEILGFEPGMFHSYLCNGLEKDFNHNFDFSPNKYGFIKTIEESIKYCEYSNSNVENLGTEDVLWLPWAVFKY